MTNNKYYYSDIEAVGKTFYPQAERIPQNELAERFPYFNFPADVKAIFQQTKAGHINPRKQIAAQNKALEIYGGTVIDDVVFEIKQKDLVVSVRTNQEWIDSKKVILATGAYANSGSIIPRKIDFGVVPHTIVLGEITMEQLPNLNGTPSLSYRYGSDPMRYIYFMPPILYPDGKFYIKIGHSNGDPMPNDMNTLTSWFQSDGDMEKVEWLSETLQNLLPDVKFASLHSKSCVTTKSPTGKQFIDQFDEKQIYAVLADNGQCAKSADEVGYIASEFVMNGRFPDPYRRADFRIKYSA